MRYTRGLSVLAGAGALAAHAFAAGFTDETAWRAAVLNIWAQDNLETYPAGTGFGDLTSVHLNFLPLNNAALSTVMSVAQVGGLSHTGPNVLLNGPVFPGNGPMTIIPDPTPIPLHAMGFWNVGSDDRVSLAFFRQDGSLIEQIDTPAGLPNNLTFIGLVSSEPVSRITITEIEGNGWFSLDDIQTSVLPAPAGSFVIGAVAMGLCFMRRPRART